MLLNARQTEAVGSEQLWRCHREEREDHEESFAKLFAFFAVKTTCYFASRTQRAISRRVGRLPYMRSPVR